MPSLLCAELVMCRVGFVPSLLCVELSHNLPANCPTSPTHPDVNQFVSHLGCILIYGIPGIHVPVFIEVYVFDTAQHQRYLADFNKLNTKLTAIIYSTK